METIAINISKSSQLKSALTGEKLTESKIKEERVLTWLDQEKACFLVKTKIDVNGEWTAVGDTEISEFKNTEEGLKLLKSGVPEPFLSAVLAVWEASTGTKKLNELEVLENEQRKT
jgi:hypothetical protein